MSATGRNIAGHERHVDDFYATPKWATKAILPHLQCGPVLDPCCGNGAILDVVKDEWRQTTWGIEINGAHSDTVRAEHRVEYNDAFQTEWPIWQVITNPPYSLALEFVDTAVQTVVRRGYDAAFLLRLNFLGSKKRAEFHRKHPSDVFVLPKRPSFKHGGTDATEYAWFVWGPKRVGQVRILSIPEDA